MPEKLLRGSWVSRSRSANILEADRVALSFEALILKLYRVVRDVQTFLRLII